MYEKEMIQEMLAEAIERGSFDPFFPIKRAVELCGDKWPRPARNYNSQEEWETQIGVKRINPWTEE